MNIDSRKLYEQFLSVYSKLSYIQRLSIVVASVATVVVIVVLMVWANAPTYETLYSELGDGDTVAIVDELERQNIRYTIANDNTIQVAGDQVYALRLNLAKLGLPSGGSTSGFELFDSTSIGATQFQEEVDYQRAIQGEIERSITSLAAVQEARVHVYIPKNNLFILDEQEDSKASIIIRLRQGETLSSQNVRAIAYFVSGAVRGLNFDQVEIIDTQGNLLSDFLGESNNALFLTTTQLEYRRKIEASLESKLNTMLGTVLGSGKSIARVSVEMDFSKRDSIIEDYGDEPVLRSEHTLDIKSTSRGAQIAGVPGVEPNLAEPNILDDGLFSNYSREERTANFEIDKSTIYETRNYGVIDRLSVSVIVDNRADITADAAGAVRPWTDAELQTLSSLVSNAVGVDVARGDTIAVENLPFDVPSDLANSEFLKRERQMEITALFLKYLTILIISFAFYIMIVRPIMKKIEIAQELDASMLGDDAIDAQMHALEISVGDNSAFPKSLSELENEIESELDESQPLDVESIKSRVMLKKIEEAANEDPEMVVNLLRTMIKSGN